MRLVHAAKYNVSSMMLQESQIHMFERNLLPANGRAPSKEKHDALDCAQQIKVAEDFANIFQNVEDVLSEAEGWIQILTCPGLEQNTGPLLRRKEVLPLEKYLQRWYRRPEAQ